MVAAARGDAVPAARLLGAAESLRERHGSVRPVTRRDEYTAAVESARQALSEGSFEIEWGRGAALPTRAAVSYALAERGRRLPRSTTGWDALTGAERTVAGLVAQGHTNAQIARELGIAAATVKAHLRRIYAKLGVESRDALAAEVPKRPRN
jgi:DNA-binding CsgD family transcriptional regulator